VQQRAEVSTQAMSLSQLLAAEVAVEPRRSSTFVKKNTPGSEAYASLLRGFCGE
jgi:hypothetical protein